MQVFNTQTDRKYIDLHVCIIGRKNISLDYELSIRKMGAKTSGIKSCTIVVRRLLIFFCRNEFDNGHLGSCGQFQGQVTKRLDG